jgi:hypothetical protein
LFGIIYVDKKIRKNWEKKMIENVENFEGKIEEMDVDEKDKNDEKNNNKSDENKNNNINDNNKDEVNSKNEKNSNISNNNDKEENSIDNKNNNNENNININDNDNNINEDNENNNNNINKDNYKRKESRRRTCPSLSNINEYLIFQLKNNLERAGKIDYHIYNLIKGKFFTIIKNHKGSKIFQKYLKFTHCDILHQIFLELNDNLEELITDPYANYFCKRFFTYLNQKDRIEFLKSIEKPLIELSSDSIGTYPIQSIIEHLNTKNEKNI